MSKRTLLIIIALLAIIDMAAALWYLALRIETSGGSGDLFTSEHVASNDSTDTIVTNVPDRFAPLNRTAYYVSNESGLRPMGCTLRIRGQWPTEINGLDSISALEQALIGVAYGQNYTTRSQAEEAFLSKPTFSNSAAATAVRSETPPKATYQIVTTVDIHPIITSQRLLVMAVDHHNVYPGAHSRHQAFVHYDRFHQRVLTRADILRPDREPQLLTVINNHIAKLNNTRQTPILSASQVASQLCCNQRGITFLYQEGEVRSRDEGPVGVLVEYTDLGDYLTDSFKNLLWSNSGYRAMQHPGTHTDSAKRTAHKPGRYAPPRRAMKPTPKPAAPSPTLNDDGTSTTTSAPQPVPSPISE